MARPHAIKRAACPVLSWLGWVCCAVAEGLIVSLHVESVLATGPVIFVVGLLSIWVGVRRRYGSLIGLGASNCAVCLLFFLLVVTLEWSPRDADTPFAVMGGIYVAVTLLITMRVAQNAPTFVQPGHCQACGYCLYGLSELRCPECGTPFDQTVCVSCGYDLTGNVSGRCPECGVVFDPLLTKAVN